MDSIFSLVWDISDYFYNAFSEVKGWVWPFSYLQYPLYALYRGFWNLLTPIANLGDWVDDVSAKVSSILSSVDIISLLRTWLTYAENAWLWVSSAWTNVLSIVNTWWSSTSQTVKVWIDDAKRYAATLVNNVSAMVSTLQVAWDAFKSKIPTLDAVIAWWSNWTGQLLSVVNTWWTGKVLEVQGLINTAFVTREQFWAGWQEWRGQVADFFSDPLEWLWSRFTDWFLGPEE